MALLPSPGREQIEGEMTKAMTEAQKEQNRAFRKAVTEYVKAKETLKVARRKYLETREARRKGLGLEGESDDYS